MSLFDFHGAAALVVGGTSGIGAAMASALLSHGATVCIAARSVNKLRATAEELQARHQGRCDWAVVDICDPSSADQMASSLSKRYGALNIIVNCAGLNLKGRIEDIATEEWNNAIRANLSGTFQLAKAALPLLKRAGWARFIVVGSVLAQSSMPMRASYAANKAGMIALVRSLAVEWAPLGITVNAISPGPFLSGVTKNLVNDPAAYQRLCNRIPMGRLGKPEEIATSCLFLASRQSSYVTGTNITVDGGWTAS